MSKLQYPTISIITPSYNQGEYIEETIRSTWDQEGDFFIEHIIADGGSDDQTKEVIQKLEKQLKNKKYLLNNKGVKLIWWSRSDRGQANAINKGFGMAKGNIISWLNSDDYLAKGSLARIVNYFAKHRDVGIIYGDMNIVDKRGQLINKCDYIQDFSLFRLLKYCFIPQPSTFIKKKVIDRVGKLNENYTYAFDYDYWLRACKNNIKFRRLNNGVISNLRTYKSRKTESGLVRMRWEVVRIMISHGYWYAPAILESFYLMLRSLINL